MDRVQRAAALAGEVIALAQSTLMVHLRFLDRALAALRRSPMSRCGLPPTAGRTRSWSS